MKKKSKTRSNVYKYKFGLSRIIKHPQGTYRVAYLTPKRELSNSVILWFRDSKGKLIKCEDEQFRYKMLRRVRTGFKERKPVYIKHKWRRI